MILYEYVVSIVLVTHISGFEDETGTRVYFFDLYTLLLSKMKIK